MTRTQVELAGVTYLVDRLEAAGLARRQPDPHHRRRFQISLGGAGEAMASAGAEQLDQALASVPDDRLAVFVEVALLIARGLDEQSGELERGSGRPIRTRTTRTCRARTGGCRSWDRTDPGSRRPGVVTAP